MAQSNAKLQIRSHSIVGTTHYVSVVPYDHQGSISELRIYAQNLGSDEGAIIDAILPDDSFSTTLQLIKAVLGVEWTLFSSEPIQSTELIAA